MNFNNKAKNTYKIISDEDLNNVTGGTGGSCMSCPYCGSTFYTNDVETSIKKEDCANVPYYKCPDCGNWV